MRIIWSLAFPVFITALSCQHDVKISEQAASKIIDLLSYRCNCKGPTEEPKCKVTRPSDCSELDKSTCKSGVYQIFPDNTGFEVYCEMEKYGGGWTVFQRRMDGSVNFYRKWETYRHGFGNLEKEFWLGNEHLHQLTSQGKYSLRVNMGDFENNQRYAVYKQFVVGDEKSGYKLTVGGYVGNAGNSMAYHNGSKFSAKDKDLDGSSWDCAKKYKGAWWYGNCHNSNLNGQYFKGNQKKNAIGVDWKDWKGYYYSLKWTTMMMRRE